jgi:hypothetical protein
MLNHPLEPLDPVFVDTYKLLFRTDAIISLMAEISSYGELYEVPDIRSLTIPKRKR